MLQRILSNERGSSAAEYALIIAVVGAFLGAAALVLGNNVTFAVGNAANAIVETAEVPT